MSEQNKGKIQALTVQNFTCFEDVSFEFSTGINVFIGENGTGKTHILKLLYALINSNEDKGDKINNVLKAEIDQLLNDKLIDAKIKVQKNNEDFIFSLGIHDDEKVGIHFFSIEGPDGKIIPDRTNLDKIIKNYRRTEKINSPSLFIPWAEMLSLYPGFISAYNKRENSFDETHYDLALALNANPLRNSALHEAEELSAIIEKELNIKVMMENDKFYIVFKNDNNRKVAAPLAAEGIKKLGQMIYLIRNGSLTKETILFWDEPEVNLNPKYIRLVADFLMSLAHQGVQIFVATHDYLLTHYLSSHAEYQEVTDAPAMTFFSFYKTENGIKIESANTIAGIQNNVLLDEYSALYDLEGSFFNQSIKI